MVEKLQTTHWCKSVEIAAEVSQNEAKDPMIGLQAM